MQFEKQTYLDGRLSYMLFAGNWKNAYLGMAFAFLGTDWLYPPRAETRKTMYFSSYSTAKLISL